MVRLKLIASELSMIIYEREEMSERNLLKYVENYVNTNYDLIPNHKSYVIDKAYEIYENM